MCMHYQRGESVPISWSNLVHVKLLCPAAQPQDTDMLLLIVYKISMLVDDGPLIIDHQ